MQVLMQQAKEALHTQCIQMPVCDAIALLRQCNIHHHVEYSASLSSTGFPHVSFPFGAVVSPAACLVNVLSARVVCRSTAEVRVRVRVRVKSVLRRFLL